MLRHIDMRRLAVFLLIAAVLMTGCGASEDRASGAQVRDLAPSASPSASITAEAGRELIPAPFAVKTVSEDRRSVDIIAAGAAGCSEPAYAHATETPNGLLVEAFISAPIEDDQPCPALLQNFPKTATFPRALAQGENVLGECVPDEATSEGRQCMNVQAFAKLPPP
jgi:hypothetical protein